MKAYISKSWLNGFNTESEEFETIDNIDEFQGDMYIEIINANNILKEVAPEAKTCINSDTELTKANRDVVRKYFNPPDTVRSVPVYLNDLIKTDNGNFMLNFRCVEVFNEINMEFEEYLLYLTKIDEIEDGIVVEVEKLI